MKPKFYTAELSKLLCSVLFCYVTLYLFKAKRVHSEACQ